MRGCCAVPGASKGGRSGCDRCSWMGALPQGLPHPLLGNTGRLRGQQRSSKMAARGTLPGSCRARGSTWGARGHGMLRSARKLRTDKKPGQGSDAGAGSSSPAEARTCRGLSSAPSASAGWGDPDCGPLGPPLPFWSPQPCSLPAAASPSSPQTPLSASRHGSAPPAAAPRSPCPPAQNLPLHILHPLPAASGPLTPRRLPSLTSPPFPSQPHIFHTRHFVQPPVTSQPISAAHLPARSWLHDFSQHLIPFS